MKYLFICVVSILMLSSCGSTKRGYDIYAGYSQDMKMAIEGPHGNNSTYNAEYKVGVETENLRISNFVEVHPNIGYTKWTWIAVDYKMPDFLLENFGLYAGLESSVIYRRRTNKHAESSNIFNPGANIELQYRVYKKFYAGVGYNIFRAEQKLIDDGKNTRSDVMFSLYAKF